MIDSVRAGAIDAYGQLYERHVGAAYNLARQLARSSAEADDLVSEAFAKVLDTLRAGRGPDTAFRAYLLTALRHTAYDRTRRERRVELADDVAEVAPEATAVPFADTAVAGLERSLAARAFARLPERWQTVLWHTEIEGQSPAEVAPLLGLTANGVSALAYRAREGLKQAYLQVHLAETQAERCRATVDRLGAWTRGGLSKRETAQVETHLDECADCRALAAELADVNGALRGIVAPMVLGAGATGYLAAAAGTAKAAAAGAAAAASAGSASASTGSGGNVLTAAPRQLLGAAASAAALVIAVVIGLAAGDDEDPAAQVAPLPTTTVRATTAPSPDLSTTQATTTTTTEPTTTTAPTTTTEPATTTAPTTTTAEPTTEAPPAARPEPRPEPEPEPRPEPEPTPPNLVPTVPSGFRLTPGADPVEMPITVRNSGQTASVPASAALLLPPGVRSVGAPASFAGGRLAQLDGAAGQTVTCPAGTGAVTCATAQGIAPGGTATFLFHLQADWEAVTGRITGTITAGTALSVAVEVDVEVTPVEDALDLRVRQWHHGFWDPRLDVSVTNTGGRAGAMRLVVESDEHVALVALWPGCRRSQHRVVCEQQLARGATFRVPVWVLGLPWRHGVVRVSATLGTAAKSLEVPLEPHPGHDAEPEPPVGTPPTQAPAPTTTARPAPATTTPPGTTTPAPPTPTGTPTGPTTGPTTPPTEPRPTSRTEPTSATPEPTTPAPEPEPTPEPTTPAPEPCAPRPPWLPPLLGDLLPGLCPPPS
ncbi:sigma-70 family RNA polymerase sigma factor [Saccharothrix syringae]|uniref:sigma-70 family RNA polymerase sigma factor n=1 Tax=Saccharothrix syringae TaxID=103733 RepID=UPI0007C56B04|nr:sigma-70 family RNA polymerase sigma factor [Saccharothrix syringae]